MHRALKTILTLLVCHTAMFQPAIAAGPDTEVPVRGVVRPSLEATLAANITAPVRHVGFREGQHFQKGDVLIEFDCRIENAQLAAAEAAHREKLVIQKGAKYLFKQNAGSLQDVETANAQADRAKAEMDAKKRQVEGCRIIAPYDGSVSKLNINQYETATAGDELISIVHTRDPEIELIVPSDWVDRIKAGKKFGFVVDETGQKHIGIVKRTGATVDAVSQTIKVFASFSKPVSAVMPGMSGTARFQ